jgi:hypothetical protein
LLWWPGVLFAEVWQLEEEEEYSICILSSQEENKNNICLALCFLLSN